MVRWEENQIFKDLNSRLKVLIYLSNNAIILFEMQKKYRKQKLKSWKKKKKKKRQMKNQCFYQTIQFEKVKHQNFSNSKKQKAC